MKKLIITLCLALSSFNLGLAKSIDMENQAKFMDMPLAELSVLADGGDKYAQFELASRYALIARNKEITKEDKELAIKYYKLAAEQGYTFAMLRLGEYYRYGSLQRKRVPPPKEELDQAIYYFEMASKNGKNIYASTALMHLGDIYKELKDFDKALEYYEKAGNRAIPSMVEIYQDETNPNKDDKKAFELLIQASKVGINFHEKLADCYLEGKGTQKDYDKAQEIILEYLTKAKESGCFENRFPISEEKTINLVALYFMHGKYEEGIKWLNVSDKFASTVIAADFLSYLYFTGKTVERDYEKVYEIQKNAKFSTSGHYRKQRTPEFNKEIENLLQDTPSIEAFYERVKAGDPSIENLSKFWTLRTNRLGVDAVKILKIKAENEDSDSEIQLRIARVYFEEKNREEGIKWLRKSAAQGNEEAQEFLIYLEECLSEEAKKWVLVLYLKLLKTRLV